MTRIINITLVEPSDIICQGITVILTNSGLNLKATYVGNLRIFEDTVIRNNPDIVLVNASVIQNQVKEFQVLKKKLPGTRWIGLVYALADPQILVLFDEVLYINDSAGKISNLARKLLSSDVKDKSNMEYLSERETDVLKLLVAGMSNKEIADKLNISTHTVITHRKNISQKTGIKSVSGLTIYAVVKEIISVNDYRE